MSSKAVPRLPASSVCSDTASTAVPTPRSTAILPMTWVRRRAEAVFAAVPSLPAAARPCAPLATRPPPVRVGIMIPEASRMNLLTPFISRSRPWCSSHHSSAGFSQGIKEAASNAVSITPAPTLATCPTTGVSRTRSPRCLLSSFSFSAAAAALRSSSSRAAASRNS